MTYQEIYNEFRNKNPEFVDEIVDYRPSADGAGIEIYFENSIGLTSSMTYHPDGGSIDMVNHPPHYQSKNGLEAIDVIEAFTADLKGPEATNTGNVLKYMLRWKGKNGLQDLQKAKWYLERLINHVEKESEQ